ncbi:signal recognition particle-docking protein FtsY [Methanoplanus endosymbiosus]|uniref:Signal recognition particle receptor FtsY n=1 Tax=Methanoplanus endosymbiosus TaxID=33865 RepID=A0A9E7PNV8_9EURY|nr:signal recognition particle-docking protein FtsY [Methanoplanus endosymbiosus]UUX92762.1 signal recognition particle-docking protein FtsY [Methanoplanus endosymbiosus]
MFKSLKEKLKGVTRKFGSNIDEAIERDDVNKPAGEMRSVSQPEKITSSSEGKNKLISDSERIPVLKNDSSSSPVSEPENIPAEKQRPVKTGFAQKLKVLVTEREILLSEKDIKEPLEELELILLENDVAFDATEAIIEDMRENLVGQKRKIKTSAEDFVLDALKNALLNVLGEGFSLKSYINSHEKPVKILFTGVNGAGKTTSIAKVAYYLKDNGYSVVIGSGDTFRAGANEQMKTHADRVGVKVINHQEGADPSAVLFDAVSYAKAHNIDVVLGDTAGRFHNKTNLMKQLDKIKRVISPDIIAYVDEAVAGNDAVIRAEEFNNSVGTDVVVLTKADMDVKGGAAISIAHTIGKPIMFLGTGQSYGDITPFEPETVVNDLLGE